MKGVRMDPLLLFLSVLVLVLVVVTMLAAGPKFLLFVGGFALFAFVVWGFVWLARLWRWQPPPPLIVVPALLSVVMLVYILTLAPSSADYEPMVIGMTALTILVVTGVLYWSWRLKIPLVFVLVGVFTLLWLVSAVLVAETGCDGANALSSWDVTYVANTADNGWYCREAEPVFTLGIVGELGVAAVGLVGALAMGSGWPLD